MLQIVNPAKSDTIKKILKALPEPSTMTVNVYGGKDQIVTPSLLLQDMFKEMLLEPYTNNSNNFYIRNPNKSKIVNLVEHKKTDDYSKPRIEFQEATFRPHSDVKGEVIGEVMFATPGIDVKLTTYKLEIKYYKFEDFDVVYNILKKIKDVTDIEIVVTKYKEDRIETGVLTTANYKK